jgi:Predicted nucleotide-binding protein containing TIR-like domain
MKIFIGCSTLHLVGQDSASKTKSITSANLSSTNSIAFQINEKYKNEKDIEIKPWWDDKIVKPGSDFFRRILDLSNICDFGIFILSNDNHIQSDSSNISSDNVYIELGVYIANKGLENSLFILEIGVKRPSDFSGLNVVTYDFNEDAEIILSLIDEKIKSKRKNIKNYIDYQLYINKRTTDKIFENKLITKNWKSKAAYIGLDSAKTWYSIESSPDYLPGDYREKLKKFINEKLKPKVKNIQNIISLGSGIGTLDTMIVEGINFDGLKYIPIEINPYLAYRALDNVMNASLKSINSFAIIDDFEEEIAQLGDFLNHHLVRKEEASLYIMLGATFGNIENSDSFLKAYSALIDSKDFFILDATTFSKKYSIESDLDGRLKSSNVISMLIHCIEFKYQSNEDYRKNEKVKEFLSLNENERKSKIFSDNYVTVQPIDNRKSKRNITYLYRFNLEKDEISDNSILFKIKRYNAEALKNKIQQFFDLEKFDTKDYFTIPVNGILDMSFYLMRRKPNGK